MDSNEGKLFIGGITRDTTEETLSDYFSKYGGVSQTVIMRDKITGRPRGFGFVVFSDPSVLDSVLQDRHTIEGRIVEAKRALSREEQQTSRPGNYRTKKIFVGGLPSTLTQEQFHHYFETYGEITDVVIMFDQNTNRPRGFGFISFDTEDAVERVLQKTYHELNNKRVEVKRALPKDTNGVVLYNKQRDGKRFMQQQNAGGGYPPYSGYGQPGYGFGGPNPNAGYGGYGSYGFGAYGGPAGAFGGLKASWGGHGGPGYGVNMGYGGNASWNAAAGGQTGPAVSAPMSQPAGGGSGYGGEAYGYGSSDGYNANSSGYGPAGGRFGLGGDQQGTGGYNGQTGYSDASWRADW